MIRYPNYAISTYFSDLQAHHGPLSGVQTKDPLACKAQTPEILCLGPHMTG